MFWQLHLTFGEDFYPLLHSRYREMDNSDLPINDEQRQQSFILESSRVSGINLIPFFEMWGFPIGQSTRAHLNHFPLLNHPIWENESDDYINLKPLTQGLQYAFVSFPAPCNSLGCSITQASIKAYNGSDKDIFIPASILDERGQGTTVSRIESDALANKQLTSITFWSNTISIDNSALQGNPLRYINVPIGTSDQISRILQNGMQGVTSSTILREGVTPRYQWNGSNNWIPIN